MPVIRSTLVYRIDIVVHRMIARPIFVNEADGFGRVAFAQSITLKNASHGDKVSLPYGAVLFL